MKRLLLLTFFILFCNQVNAQWSLVWSDEFTGPSLDLTNWAYDTGTGNNGWGNNELEYYTNYPTNITINNGNLLIIARKESYGGCNYTSARINTQHRHSWTYGMIEARIKMPVGQGTWPAFWMLGQSVDTIGWPECGEIDIMEHINNEEIIYGTMHWYNNGHVQYGDYTPCNVSQYHIYSVEWDQNAIKWMVDGNQFLEGNIAGGIDSTEEFQHPFFIILNLAIGGTWPGLPNDSTVFPDTMFVDYVRVYQQTSDIKEGMNRNTMNIFQNTITGNITVEVERQSSPRNMDICMYDLQGQLIKSFTTNKSRTNIDISSLSTGMYIIKAKTEKATITKKFIKQ